MAQKGFISVYRCMIASLLLTMLVGCNADAISLEAMRDPTEGAFTINLPKGWRSNLGVARQQDQAPRNWIRTESPDGASQWFFGDPSLSSRVDPRAIDPTMHQGLRQAGYGVVEQQDAAQFGREYLVRAYGQATDFTITASRPNTRLAELIRSKQQEAGLQAQVSSHLIEFQFSEGPVVRSGELWANVIVPANSQGFWYADTAGFVTSKPSEAHSALFAEALYSLEPDPQWRARERTQHQQRMAANSARDRQRMASATAAHQQRMASQRASFQAHQNRMAQQSAANDAQYNSWRAGQNADYESHQNFVRGIHDRTLVTPDNSGYGAAPQYEVDAGYNHYYVDPNSQQYFGTDTELEPGLIPEGYEAASPENQGW